jgi:hypothetical protein
MEPTVFNFFANQYSNRDRFWDRPIETEAEKRRLAKARYNEYTSRVAIWLGEHAPRFRTDPATGERVHEAVTEARRPGIEDLFRRSVAPRSRCSLGPPELEREKAGRLPDHRHAVPARWPARPAAEVQVFGRLRSAAPAIRKADPDVVGRGRGCSWRIYRASAVSLLLAIRAQANERGCGTC